MFAYGSQYFRHPQPREDWETDLDRMVDLGFNTIKVWPMWNAIHLGEDEFDFSPLDDFVAAAAARDLEIHVSLLLENAPHWLAQQHPEARYLDHHGERADLIARANTPGGGWPGLCLNHDSVRKHGERFIRALGGEFADVDAVSHYAVWDESFFEPNRYYPDRRFCYCDACTAAFREWLETRYGDLDGVNDAWAFSYTDWAQVTPPRYSGGYPRHLDWLRFRLDNHQRHTQWRADAMSEAAPNSTIRAHGIGGNLGSLAERYNDDWRSASTVEEWGTSSFPGTTEGFASNDGVDGSVASQSITLDVARGAAQGRRFWQTELQGGQLTGGSAADLKGLTRGSTPTADEVALWNWTALASGAKGILYWQYRPELLGPESPGFGLVRRDGELTERAEAAGRFAGLVGDHPEIEAAEPARGDVAIGLLPDAPLFNFVAEQDVEQYSSTVRGAYRAFWDANFQVDFAKPHQFDAYDVVYLPFPLLLTADQADAVAEYVRGGGALLADGAPAVYDETGRVVREAPGYDLRDVFGAALATTRYAGDEALELDDETIPATSRRDIFEPAGADVIGAWSDGGVGAVRHEYGDGTAVALGTLCGRANATADDERSGDALRALATELGASRRVAVDRSDVRARVHEYDGGSVLYVTNLTDGQRRVGVTVEGGLGNVEKTVGDVSYHDHAGGGDVVVELPARDGGALVTSRTTDEERRSG